MNVKINLCEIDIRAIIAEKYNVPVELVDLQCIPDLRDTYRKPDITADIILPEERALFVDNMMRAKKEPDITAIDCESLTSKAVTNPCHCYPSAYDNNIELEYADHTCALGTADWNCCHTDGATMNGTTKTEVRN